MVCTGCTTEPGAGCVAVGCFTGSFCPQAARSNMEMAAAIVGRVRIVGMEGLNVVRRYPFVQKGSFTTRVLVRAPFKLVLTKYVPALSWPRSRTIRF